MVAILQALCDFKFPRSDEIAVIPICDLASPSWVSWSPLFTALLPNDCRRFPTFSLRLLSPGNLAGQSVQKWISHPTVGPKQIERMSKQRWKITGREGHDYKHKTWSHRLLPEQPLRLLPKNLLERQICAYAPALCCKALGHGHSINWASTPIVALHTSAIHRQTISSIHPYELLLSMGLKFRHEAQSAPPLHPKSDRPFYSCHLVLLFLHICAQKEIISNHGGLSLPEKCLILPERAGNTIPTTSITDRNRINLVIRYRFLAGTWEDQDHELPNCNAVRVNLVIFGRLVAGEQSGILGEIIW